MKHGTDTMSAAEFRQLIAGGKIPEAVSKPSGNRKVCNATKTEGDGIMFDSRTEKYMNDLLEFHGIPFLRQKKYTLQESFTYNGESIRAITYTVDYELPTFDIVIDTKGILTQQGRIRIKMLMRLFADLGRRTRIELPHDKAECDALVVSLIQSLKIEQK